MTRLGLGREGGREGEREGGRDKVFLVSLGSARIDR